MPETGPVDTIYRHIQSQIDSKTVFPGYRIIEEDLAKELKLSRTSIRAALAKLQYDGLVEIIPKRGTYVAKPTRQDILNVYTTRLHLEIGVLEQAMPKICGEAIARMEENLEAQKELKKHFTITEYAHLNRAFHWEVVKAAHNPFFSKYLNELYNRVKVYLVFFDTSTDNSGSLQSHSALLQALKEKNLEAGIEAVKHDYALGINDIRSTF